MKSISYSNVFNKTTDYISILVIENATIGGDNRVRATICIAFDPVSYWRVPNN